MKRIIGTVVLLPILFLVAACGIVSTGEDKVFSVGETGVSLTAPDTWKDITSMKDGEHDLLLTRIDIAVQIRVQSATQKLEDKPLSDYFEDVCTYMPVVDEAYSQVRDIEVLTGNGLTVYRALFSIEQEDTYSFLFMVQIPDTDHLFTVAASGSPSIILDAEEELAEMMFSLSVA